MPDLAGSLKSEPPVEDAASRILDELVASRQLQINAGNFASTYTGLPPGESGNAIVRIVFEALQWLQSNGRLSAIGQPGWEFVTRRGEEIGRGGGLKTYLEQQTAASNAAAAAASKELSELKKRAEEEIRRTVEEKKKESDAIL